MLAAAVAVVASRAVRSAGQLAERLCGDSFFGVTAGPVHILVGRVGVAVVASVMVIVDIAGSLRVRG